MRPAGTPCCPTGACIRMHVTFQYVAPLRHSFWLPHLAILIAAGRVLVQHVLRLYCIRLKSGFLHGPFSLNRSRTHLSSASAPPSPPPAGRTMTRWVHSSVHASPSCYFLCVFHPHPNAVLVFLTPCYTCVELGQVGVLPTVTPHGSWRACLSGLEAALACRNEAELQQH